MASGLKWICEEGTTHPIGYGPPKGTFWVVGECTCEVDNLQRQVTCLKEEIAREKELVKCRLKHQE
jgi:hypothetical protein